MQDTFNPKDFEKRIYKRWLDNGCFTAKRREGRKPFSIVLPPPNITGQLHLGHAMNTTIPDAIVRFKRMQGFDTLWLPGVDHASIATEARIVAALKKQGLDKRTVGREAFLKRAREWKEEYGSIITEQLKEMGLSLDWSRTAYTMDGRCSRAVLTVFKELYDKGYIYRGDRIVNWCPECKTAISDAEVEHETCAAHLYYLRYPIVSGGHIVVATTRPETMLGDTAVAVNPTDARYKKLIGKNIALPLTDRVIPVIGDSFVKKEFGTGAVKITPAHDPDDFEAGLRNKLEQIKVIDDNGLMNENAGSFCGMEALAARKAVMERLAELDLVEKIEDYTHNVGHCHRCHTAVQPSVSKQWFVKMKELAAPAISAVKDGNIRFIPKRFEKQYFNWMNNIRDWCISRQLWWGHRIPVYYCDACGQITVSCDDITACSHCGGTVRQDEDVLDTWFSSALWPYATMGWPDKTPDLEYFYPTNLLITAYDIITFWVARMIFTALEFTNTVPFSEVFIHGLVRDGEGRKMSKSSGNGIDPLDIINTAGADALRFTMVHGIAVGGDTCFSYPSLTASGNFMNKLFNASRFVLKACGDAEPQTDFKRLSLCDADKWILHRLNAAVAEVTKAYNRYDIGRAASVLYDFIWTDFCDKYIELSKLALRDGQQKNAAASVLLYALKTLLKLAHPIIPFITTEIYDALPFCEGELMMLDFPKVRKLSYNKAAASVDTMLEVIRALRNLKQTNTAIDKSPEITVVKTADSALVTSGWFAYFERLAGVGAVSFAADKPQTDCAPLVFDGFIVYVPLKDSGAERDRLKEEYEQVLSELNRAQGKLNNQGFIAKAPKSLVDAEAEKVQKYSARLQVIKEKLGTDG